MEGSSLQALLDRLNTDEDLRAKFIEAENSARRDGLAIRKQIHDLRDANVATLSKIAEEAGYDISDAMKRPSDFQPTPTEQELEAVSAACILTCCFVLTSVYGGETIFGPGCTFRPPYWTTDFCV
jgi:hypothetical protein